jgi:hypothetical protein
MKSYFDLTEPGLLRTTVGAMAQWRLFVLWVILTLIPTAIFALPVFVLLASMLDHSVYATQWAETFNLNMFTDLSGVLFATPYPRSMTLGVAGMIAVVLVVFIGPFLNGAVIASAQANRTLGFSLLIKGGLALYGRMIRVTIWSFVPLGIAFSIIHALSKWNEHRAQSAILESTVKFDQRIGLGVTLLLLLLVHVSIEAARAQFALNPTRRSAVLAWWRATRFVKRRPLAVFISYILIEGVAICVVLVLALLHLNLPHAHPLGVSATFLLTQLTVIVIAWMQVARLLVLCQLTRETARRRIEAGLSPN